MAHRFPHPEASCSPPTSREAVRDCKRRANRSSSGTSLSSSLISDTRSKRVSPCNINLRDAYSLKKMTALLCLYKYPGEPSQPLAVPCRFLAEKPLVGTERRAHKIDRNMATVQTVQIVAPYLILDKNGDFGMCQPHETAHSQRSVEGKITDTIGSGPIFAHLVARRGIESEQNLILRMLATHHLNQRTPLLEFAEGCRMNPENLVAGCERSLQFPPYTSLAGGKPPTALTLQTPATDTPTRYRIIPHCKGVPRPQPGRCPRSAFLVESLLLLYICIRCHQTASAFWHRNGIHRTAYTGHHLFTGHKFGDVEHVRSAT